MCAEQVVVDPDKRLFTLRVDESHVDFMKCSMAFRTAREAPGGALMSFCHDEGPMKMLARYGYDVVKYAPFMYYRPRRLVEGDYEPMPHQLETAAFLTLHDRAYLLSTMRTGKTASVIMALDYLSWAGIDTGKTLIICPVSVMRGVWERSLRTTVPGASVATIRGSADRRAGLMLDGADYMIINYDGLEVVSSQLSAFMSRGLITKVVIDELSNYGTPRAQRYRRAWDLFNGKHTARRLWGLTGTPGADTLAVYGYARMVTPSRMPYTSLDAWRQASQYKYGREAWMWSDKPGTPALIRKMLSPSIRFTREQVLKSLPALVRTERTAALTREQERAHQTMKREMIVAFENGEVTEVSQKAALLSKLFQICLGSVITASGGRTSLDSKPRMDLLAELVWESERKSVIFCSFVGAIDETLAALRKRGISAAKVDGTVTGPARDEIFRSFQHDPEPRALVAHPQTTAYGTELAAADQLIFNGPMLSGAHIYMQGLARLSSAKQTSGSVQIIEVSASEEERLFFDSLRQRKQQADAVGELFKSIVERSI